MSQSSAESQWSRSEAHRVARRAVFKGSLIGVSATLTLVLLAWVVTQTITSGPKTFQTTCRGASVTGTIWVDEGSVVVSVAVLDPSARDWEVAWGGYADEIRASRMAQTPAKDGLTQLSAVQPLTDLDDGTHRTAQVRPDGQKAWCDLDMHVSWVW